MRTVVVFCAEGKKPTTIQAVKKLYGNENVNIIWTATSQNWGRNFYGEVLNVNNKNVTVPISSSNNPNAFNASLARILGNRKVDLFIFEFCPLLHALNHLKSNRIMNIIKKYSKNNSRIITHTQKRNWSTRLAYNRTLNINSSVNRNYNKPRFRQRRKINIAAQQAHRKSRLNQSNSNSNNNNTINNVSNNNSAWNVTQKVNVFKFL